MLIKAILVAIVAFFCYFEPVFGYSQYNRPIVTGALIGLVLGDLKTGLMVGASLELAFMGTIAIGGALPPDVFTGGILGAAFAISTGTGVGGALALAIPIATLALLVKNVIYMIVRVAFAHRADVYAEKGNYKGVARMHWASQFAYQIPMTIIVGISFYVGGPAVQTFLHVIPDFVTRGLTATSGILPALGFAMLAQMIINKKVALFFFLGFTLAAYLNIPVLGIAALALIFALLISFYVNNNKLVTEEANKDEDF
jgi:fructoselysine and glucoselysine-specific PTS system IIC component